MDDPSVDPLVDTAIKRIEERLGHAIVCPLCASDEWGTLDTRFIRLFTPGEIPETTDDLDDTDMTRHVLGLSCKHCAYVWFHLISETFEE